MAIEYKNTLHLKDRLDGVERRRNLAKEVLQDGTPFPNTVDYHDIDEEFNSWVSRELGISYDGNELPTYFMLSNQRFSEYVQSWENVDDKKNIILNFKYITREYNPKTGTINGSTKNIPGERTYLLKRVVAHDKNNREYYIDYRMKQPFGIDLRYTISLVTNKLELLNEFNTLINDKFKSITNYIRPKGHYMSMILNDISDQSDNSLDDRRYYSQNYDITVRAYIINDDSFETVEVPKFHFDGIEEGKRGAYADIDEDLPPYCDPKNSYEYKALRITSVFERCLRKLQFTMDSNMKITKIYGDDNLRNFTVYVNGELIYEPKGIHKHEGFELKPNDKVEIRNVFQYNARVEAKVFMEGYDWTSSCDTEKVNSKPEDITLKVE